MSNITVNSGLYSEDKRAEIISEYERDILPLKIKKATDKLNKQWTHALSKSNRRTKAIAARDNEWVQWIETYVCPYDDVGIYENGICKYKDNCQHYKFTSECLAWQERKRSLGIK